VSGVVFNSSNNRLGNVVPVAPQPVRVVATALSILLQDSLPAADAEGVLQARSIEDLDSFRLTPESPIRRAFRRSVSPCLIS